MWDPRPGIPHLRERTNKSRRNASTASTRRWSSPLGRQVELREDARRRASRPRAASRTSALGDGRFERPSAISSRTSRSRGVSASTGSSARRRPSSWPTTAGSSADAALADAPHRVGELLDVGDPVLEQVPDPLAPPRPGAPSRSAGSTYCDRTSTPVRRLPRTDRRGRAQPLVGVRRRHPDVHDRDVGLVSPTCRSRSSRVARLADDLEAGFLEQPATPSRSRTESSAITTRMRCRASPPCRAAREVPR